MRNYWIVHPVVLIYAIIGVLATIDWMLSMILWLLQQWVGHA